jgi:DNA-binding transcriptional MerR regulator
VYTIREAARRSGVGVSLIRAWERRYGLVDPKRTPAGYRLYDDDAVARLRRVRQLTDAGWSASEAGRAVLAGEEGAVASVATSDGPIPLDRSGSPEAFLDAAAAMDGARLGTVLDDMLALGTFERVVDDVLMPALVAVGRAWADGNLDVAAEHAATAAVQRRLAALFEAAAVPGETRAVVGLPPGSRHELGALAFAVSLARRGVGVLYLGADLPVDSWLAAMRDPDRRLAVIGIVTEADRRAAAEVAAALDEADATITIAVGGRASLGGGDLGTDVVVLPERIGEASAVAARLVVTGSGRAA